MTSVAMTGVKTVETFWIPMPDGRRLAARLFLPENPAPVPLIMEYIPYRRRDGTRTGDDEMHLWFAAHGYACARVDIAGTGDSDGVMDDEYLAREQDDGVAALDFLTAQPWCSGQAAMIGISWGGFSALQIAARRPAALRTIITICSTDDRYACDAHYNGGLLINDNFGWGGALFSIGAQPPDPAVVGPDRWRDLWQQRIDAHHLYPATWLRHQRRDAFWKHGSVCEDYSAIACPVLAVGGFLDGYTPTIFRLVENMPGQAWGLCGPWGHKEPQSGVPGPAIGFLQECVRWFDHWLKGVPNGVADDPVLRLWLMDTAAPASHIETRPGRWVGFPQWPARQTGTTTLHLGGTALHATAPQHPPLRHITSPLTTGLQAQEWCPYGQGRIAAEGAMDQRADDAGSLCFDTEVLIADLAIVGTPSLHLRLCADQPQAMVAARLCSVAPDGTSAFISFALLNLSHRHSHEFPALLTPGEFETVTLQFKPIAQTIPAGYRLRLAISSSYWPLAWPSPAAVLLTVDPAGSWVNLPTLQSTDGLTAPAFGPALWATPGPVTEITPARQLRTITLDVPTERTTLAVLSDDGRSVLDEIGTEVTSWRKKEYSIARHYPTSCTTTVHCGDTFRRGDWNVSVECAFTVTTTAQAFHLTGWLKAHDGDTLFATRDYDEIIPRDHL